MHYEILTIAIIYLCLYLDPAIYIMGMQIPSVLSILIIIACRKHLVINKEFVELLMVLVVASIISVGFSSAEQSTTKIISSITQIIYALYLSSVISNKILEMDRDDISSGIRLLFALMSILFLLDYLGFIADASNYVSGKLYSGGVGFEFYGSNDYSLIRDTELSGGRRPSVFSPEPSIAVLGLTLVGILLLVSSAKASVLLFVSLYLMLLWYVYRSPIPLGGVLIVFVYAYNQVRLNLRPLLALLFIIGAPIITYLVWQRFEKFSYDIELVATSSEGIRFILPFENAFGLLLQGEIFGGGPGANTDPQFVSGLNKYWSPIFGTNALAQILLIYGFVFTPIIIFLYWRSSKFFGVDRFVTIFSILVFVYICFSLGAIESVRLMGFWALIVSIFLKFKYPNE
jgi:hypothetical protein